MSEVRDLRPYLDVLVDDVLAGVLSERAPVATPRRAPWRLIVVGVIVAVGVVLAVLSIRSVSDREGSVRVPPAQQTPDDRARSAGACASTGTRSVFDHATGQVVQIAESEFCESQIDANGYSPEELLQAGIVPETSAANGKMNVTYLEANVTRSGGSVVVEVTSVVVPEDEVQRRVAAVRAGR